MKIAFCGGGTGGHFYPIIAVAEEIHALTSERHLVEPQLFYLAPNPYNARLLYENNIEFRRVPAGKWRRYFSIANLFDGGKTLLGLLIALSRLFIIYPDIIFSKGGYASFPILWAGRLLRIPIIIHESDSHPGRVSLWSSKFAVRIALSYPEALKYFPEAKTAVTGNPIRREVLTPIKDGAHEFLHLSTDLPVIYVTGGSQGAEMINNTLIDILPSLLEKYQIIHQTGADNLEDIKKRVEVVLAGNQNRAHYQAFAYLNADAIKMAAGAANLIISRAGSSIFEIAQWGIPAIIIPIPEPISHDQRTNAFTYARSGGATIIEQANLTPSVLLSEINRILSNPELQTKMSTGAKKFARPDAAKLIAEALLAFSLEHEG